MASFPQLFLQNEEMLELFFEGDVFEDAHGAILLETFTLLSLFFCLWTLLSFRLGFLKLADWEGDMSLDLQILFEFIAVGANFLGPDPFEIHALKKQNIINKLLEINNNSSSVGI